MIMGETVYIDDEAVSNVLVHVGEALTSGSTNEKTDDWQGPIADYTLYFPIDYEGELSGKTVNVRGIECDVIGHPDHERPQQIFGTWLGSWDMTVRVRRTIKEVMEQARVYIKTVQRDATGRRTEATETLYEGALQARMSSGTETDKNDGTKALTSYVFVMDWLDALDEHQAQEIFVEYKGKTFDISSVENKDEKNETAILRGDCYE